MTKVQSLVVIVTAFAAAAPSAFAQDRMSFDQARARAAQAESTEGRRAAERRPLVPLPRVVATVRAQAPFDRMEYLGGPMFDPVRHVYRLRFLDGRRLVEVLVDAGTGRVLGVR